MSSFIRSALVSSRFVWNSRRDFTSRRQAVPKMDRLLELGGEVGEDVVPVDAVEGLGELHHRLLEAVLQDAVAVLDPRPDVVGLARHGDVEELGVDHLLQLEGHAVDEGVVELVEGRLGIEGLQDLAAR